MITALKIEYEAVRCLMTNVHERTGTDVFTTGELADSGRRIALVESGMYNVTAAARTQEAIDRFSPVAILLVGVAGGLRDDIRIGDVVVGTKIYALHPGKEDDSGVRTRLESLKPNENLRQSAANVDGDGTWSATLSMRPTVHFKPIVSGDRVLNSRHSESARLIAENFSDAYAIDLESYGVAEAAHLKGVPALTVRGISDLADGNKRPATDVVDQPLAAANAAQFAAAVIAGFVSVLPRPKIPPDDGVLAVMADLAQAVHVKWTGIQRRRAVDPRTPMAVRWTASGGRTGRFKDIGGFFAQAPDHRLVIRGGPGSGKTTMAGELVLDVLERRAPEDSVPVLFSLGTWDPTKQTLHQWLVDELHRSHPGLGARLPSRLGERRTIAEALVHAGSIFPVLDGFESIPPPVRVAAVAAINRLQNGCSVVLTSRTSAYDELGSDEKLSGAEEIVLEPLRPDDVADYLSGDRWRKVRSALIDTPGSKLAEALDSPLMAWLAREVHDVQRRHPDELYARSTEDVSVQDIKKGLVDAFIEAAYPEYPVDRHAGAPVGNWKARQTRRWLRFLASKVRRDAIEWWRLDATVPGLAVLCRFLVGATLGFGMGTAMTDVTAGLVTAVILGALAASERFLRFAGVGDLSTPHTFRFGREELKRDLGSMMLTLLIGTAGFALLLFGFFVGVGGSWRNFAVVAVAVTSMIAGLVLLGWLFLHGRKSKSATVTTIDVSHAISPSSTLRDDRNVAVIGLATFLVLLVPVGLFTIGFASAVPLAGGFGLAFFFGSAYFRFCVARVVLAAGGRLPWRLMTFLRDAADRHMMQQVGAVHQFRHDLMRERLRG
ncbi:5'-methylthioadenosine/S-adenosylhomocysteine nucleosidase [Kibdelosporangium aridum]|uniref:5'-methylthioadenosine/S-adenosylhomocysteine nucleosidase n=1 Tax=Kibdelosporangium aridum TaxID=2030 RepID=UPI00055DE4FA|nr:5'-methylthioadenosine/S-adenosylhomocysteine nucleosidase [Kibdelosporangium aridum]